MGVSTASRHLWKSGTKNQMEGMRKVKIDDVEMLQVDKPIELLRRELIGETTSHTSNVKMARPDALRALGVDSLPRGSASAGRRAAPRAAPDALEQPLPDEELEGEDDEEHEEGEEEEEEDDDDLDEGDEAAGGQSSRDNIPTNDDFWQAPAAVTIVPDSRTPDSAKRKPGRATPPTAEEAKVSANNFGDQVVAFGDLLKLQEAYRAILKSVMADLADRLQQFRWNVGCVGLKSELMVLLFYVLKITGFKTKVQG